MEAGAFCLQESGGQDFSGGSVLKNLPSNAGDVGLILGWGAEIPPARGQPSLSHN